MKNRIYSVPAVKGFMVNAALLVPNIKLYSVVIVFYMLHVDNKNLHFIYFIFFEFPVEHMQKMV